MTDRSTSSALMDHRNGTCTSCGATYKIPASFTHDRARCKECGGTVEIGPVVSGSASGEPAAASGEGLVPYVPSGKKRSGPSMMEQLRARRAQEGDDAAETKPAAAQRPAAPRKASAPAPARRVPAPAAKPAAVRPSRAAAPADEDGEESEDTGSAGRGRRSGGRAGARGGSKRGGSKRSREPREPKGRKGNPMMFVGLGGLVVLVGVGAWFVLRDTAPEVGAADPGAPAAETAPATAGAAREEQPAAPQAPAVAATAPAGAQPAATPARAPVPTELQAPEPKASARRYDPSTIDLAAFGTFGPAKGTTTAEWEQLVADMQQAMDRSTGVAGARAQKKLESNGRKAFPVILNFLLGLDFAKEEDNVLGMQAQRMLETICRGQNYGWKEHGEVVEGEPEYWIWFNKKAVEGWCKGWQQAHASLKAWKNLAKLTDAEFAELQAELGAEPDEPSALDILDD